MALGDIKIGLQSSFLWSRIEMGPKQVSDYWNGKQQETRLHYPTVGFAKATEVCLWPKRGPGKHATLLSKIERGCLLGIWDTYAYGDMTSAGVKTGLGVVA